MLYGKRGDLACQAAAVSRPWRIPQLLRPVGNGRLRADESEAPTFALQFAPSGVISDARIDRAGKTDASWQSGVRVAIDVDGSLNQAAGEDDEEWLVFAALPWTNLGIVPKPGLRLHIFLGRCDTLRSGERRCGHWRGRASAAEGVFLLGAATPTAN